MNQESNQNPAEPKKVHIICNTHWDRAWVYPFQETRLLLLEFMDDLLDLLERDSEFHSFLLDSQTIAVEDYLELRPEREEQIKKFVRAGRLIVGPWYTLPEEYIVNGESLVRNLVIGHRLAEKWGKVSKIGYTPFSYGQTSQMPQIYRGFDIDTIIFYRGINTKKSEFVLEGPDGSRVTGCRFGALSRFSYYFYVYRMARFGMGRDEWWYDWDRGALPFRLNGQQHLQQHNQDHYYPLDIAQEQFNTEVLPAQLKKLIEDESEHFSTRHIACMQGFDCSSPDPNERDLIELSRPIVEEMGHEIVQGSLEDYMREMMTEVKDPEVLTGESRNPGATGKWTHLMGDVISSRIKIKRRNAQVEVGLQRRAEPFSALGWLSGGQYMRSAIDRAWRYLMQNHPHDNICGAGIDQMEKDMHYRFDQAEIISAGVTRRGLGAIQQTIDNRDIGLNEAVLTVFNPSPHLRSEVVNLSIDLPDQCQYEGFSLRDSEGNPLTFVETGREPYGTLVRNLQDISLQLRSTRVSMQVELQDIPALGYATYRIAHEGVDLGCLPQDKIEEGANANSKPPVLENDCLQVTIQPDGSLDLLDKQTGHTFTGQHYFEDSGEAGHAWIHMAPGEDQILTTRGTQATIECLESNELITRYRVSHRLTIPVGLKDPVVYADDGDKASRSAEMVELPIDSMLTLRKGQRWLEVHTTIENQAEQHRLRACFPTRLPISHSAAEAAFDVVERSIVQPPESNYYGGPNPQFPMHRFVDMSDGQHGLAILNEGLREYEAMVDDDRTLAITLVRSFTAMQTPVIGQWDVYPWMKLAQSLGTNQCHYAILPHAGNWQDGNLYRAAEHFDLPLETAQAGRGGGQMPKDHSFLQVGPETIALSACKQCDQRDSLIVRLYNPTSEEVTGQIDCDRPLQEAWITNMNEERREQLKVTGNSVEIPFMHKQIVTVELALEAEV
ncbi:MAG: glycoside hydrolase family 38 C-terminal domain-containing protein [Pirellulales bacterium]